MNDSDDYIDLIEAAGFGKTDIMEEALKMGANINAQGSNKRTALHQAIHHWQLSAVKWLIGRDADAGVKDYRGMTPLMLAKEDGYQAGIDLLTPGNDCVSEITS